MNSLLDQFTITYFLPMNGHCSHISLTFLEPFSHISDPYGDSCVPSLSAARCSQLLSSNERSLLAHLSASSPINSQFSQNFLYMSKGSQIGQGQPQLYTWPWVTDNIFGSGSFISCFIISTLLLSFHVYFFAFSLL